VHLGAWAATARTTAAEHHTRAARSHHALGVLHEELSALSVSPLLYQLLAHPHEGADLISQIVLGKLGRHTSRLSGAGRTASPGGRLLGASLGSIAAAARAPAPARSS